MARGKYKNSAEARQARESAIAEAARLRRENEALRREGERLKAEMKAQHDADLALIADLRAHIKEGTSEQVEELRRSIAGLKEQREALRREHVEQVVAGMTHASRYGQVAMAKEDWPKVADLFGVKLGDLFAAMPNANRKARRMTSSRARAIEHAKAAARADGFVG